MDGEKVVLTYGGSLSNGFLHVDPNKEVKVRGVVIGGYTTDDILESKKRNQLELESNCRTQFESWNSFLRKVNIIEGKYTSIIQDSPNIDFPIGARVKNKIPFHLVPVGTEGIVYKHYGNGGIMIVWDLPNRSLPKKYDNLDTEEYMSLGFITDGFSKEDTKYLERLD